MTLVAVAPAEQPTELLHPIRDAEEPRELRRLSSLVASCIGLIALLAATLSLLGGWRAAEPGEIAVGWLVATGLALMLATVGLFAALLRDFADRRTVEVAEAIRADEIERERRYRELVQCETYRLEHAHMLTRQQMALIRAEMQALLGQLPKGIIDYGDERDDEGEGRAVRRLTAANGTDGPVRAVASVTPLRPVDRSR